MTLAESASASKMRRAASPGAVPASTPVREEVPRGVEDPIKRLGVPHLPAAHARRFAPAPMGINRRGRRGC